MSGSFQRNYEKALHACSCGATDAHVIGSRKTSDGIVIELWSDGALANRVGAYIKHPKKNTTARKRAIEIGRKLLDSASMYEFSELPYLYNKIDKELQ